MDTENGDTDNDRGLSATEGLDIAEFLRSSSACLAADIVDLLMNEYYQIFGQGEVSPSRMRAGEPKTSSQSNGERISRQKDNSGNSETRIKRGRTNNDKQSGDDENDKEPEKKRAKDNSHKPESPEESLRRFACPYHKHNPQYFRRATSDKFQACDNKGFDTIGHLKEHLQRAHYGKNKCSRCKHSLGVAEHRSHVEPLESCGVRAEYQGEIEAGFSHAFGMWLKQKKRSATLAEGIQRWREIYEELFPDIMIPCPFHGSTSADSSFEVPRQHAATSVDNPYSLQSQAVEARFREQVNAEVEATVNGLQPTVRRLLEQAPATIRDSVDSGFTHWEDFELAGSNQPYFSSGLQPSHAHVSGPSETLNNRTAGQTNSQLRNMDVTLFGPSDSDVLRNEANLDSLDSAYGEGINDTALSSFGNPGADTGNNTDIFNFQDPTYIDNRIQTQVRAEIAPLTRQIGDIHGLLRQALQQATRVSPHDDGPTTDRNVSNDHRLLLEPQHGSNVANRPSRQSEGGGGSNGCERDAATGPDHLGELSSFFDM